MTWRYRTGDGWETLTPKRRENGEWVSFDDTSPTDEQTSEYPGLGENYELPYGSPPTREGGTITVGTNSEDYSTIQAAINNVQEDETILVSPGTYTESLDLSDASANGWTLRGDGTSPSDVVIIRDGSNVIGSSGGEGDIASSDVTGTMEIGDEYIPVASTSGFEAGMDVNIYDPNQEAYDGGDGTQMNEMHTIETVDSESDRLYVEHDEGIVHPWTENSSDHEVRSVEWGVKDVHVDNMRFDGQGGTSSSRRGWNIQYIRDLWITDVEVTDGGYSGFNVTKCWYVRYDNVSVEDIVGSRGYGFNNVGSGAHLLTNCESNNTNAYGIKFGGSSGSHRGSFNVRAEDCDVYDAANYAVDSHEGPREVYYVNINAEDCQGMGRISTPGMHFHGCHLHNWTGNSGAFRATNYSFDVEIHDQLFTGEGRGSSNHHLLRFHTYEDHPNYHDYDVRRVTMDFDTDIFVDSDGLGSATFSHQSGDYLPPHFEGEFYVENFEWLCSDTVDCMIQEEFIDHGSDVETEIGEGSLQVVCTDE